MCLCVCALICVCVFCFFSLPPLFFLIVFSAPPFFWRDLFFCFLIAHICTHFLNQYFLCRHYSFLYINSPFFFFYIFFLLIGFLFFPFFPSPFFSSLLLFFC